MAAASKRATPPTRTVLCRDALTWLSEHEVLPGSVITSLPDYSEMEMAIEPWKEWFINAAFQILSRLADSSHPLGPTCAIFYQTDIKLFSGEGIRGGIGHGPNHRVCDEWIDKSLLCHTAAIRASCRLQWHKICLRHPVNALASGRMPYTHLLCYSKVPLPASAAATIPDVFDRGGWSKNPKAMGASAAILAANFVIAATGAERPVIDPFCGRGTVLAAANLLGVDAIGVDISPKCCRKANQVKFTPDMFQTTEDSVRNRVVDGIRPQHSIDAGESPASSAAKDSAPRRTKGPKTTPSSVSSE